MFRQLLCMLNESPTSGVAKTWWILKPLVETACKPFHGRVHYPEEPFQQGIHYPLANDKLLPMAVCKFICNTLVSMWLLADVQRFAGVSTILLKIKNMLGEIRN
jgi:hypothetical protein